MKIVIIHGQSHEGSTCHIARMLAEKINGEVTEFFCREILGNFVSVVRFALRDLKSNARILINYRRLQKQ